MNNGSIAIYDVNLINHKNYIGDVISQLCCEVDVYAFYDEFNVEAFDFLSGLGVTCVQVGSISKQRIESLFISNNIGLLIHNAQRLGDTAFVCIAKLLGIQSVMIQHGMYIPHLKREKSLFVKKFVKTFRYAKYSHVISKSINKSFTSVFISFYRHFVKNVDYTTAIPFYAKINSDVVFVYGEYWVEYHQKNFGYSPKQCQIIGYHELNKSQSIKMTQFKQDTLCYVAQTLVEDGRMAESDFKKFLFILRDAAINAGKKVIVKLHPRSNQMLYADLDFEFSFDELPNVGSFVGHYSSLLALANAVSPLIIYKLDGHVIPDYFLDSGRTCSSKEELSSLLLEDNKKTILGNLERVFSPTYDTCKVVSSLIKIKDVK